MKVYYLEPGMFPATYNFKDEVVGTTGTSIGFINTEAGTDSTYSATIIAEHGNHKKVIQFLAAGDNGTYAYWRHNPTDQASGTIEIWAKYIDRGVGRFNLYFMDSGGSMLWYCYFNSADNKFYCFYGDGVGGHTSANVAIATNIWTHLKFTWDCTTDKFSCWVNGSVLVNNQNFYDDLNGTALATYRVAFDSGAGANSLQAYIDAVGESWDANYTIGENLYKKWHVSTQTQVTKIVTYPNPVQQNNAFTACTMVLRDFEGALYATWKDLDQVKMRIEDDSSNVLWRGLLDNKRFSATGLTLELVSFGRQLEWKSFGSKENVSYIMDKGIVDLCNASSIIDLKDDDGVPFTWTPDCWIGVDKDLGFIILDNTTDYSEKTWDISTINEIGVNASGGAVVDTQTFDDGNYYYATDTGSTVNMVIDLDVDGLVIDSTTEELKEIEIQFNWRMKIKATTAWNKSRVELQILKDTEWITFSQVYKERIYGSTYTNWLTGVPTEEGGTPIENGNNLQEVISGTDVELQKYFDKDNGNYSKLKGLRFIVSGQRTTGDDNYTRVYIDFIKVIVKHHAEDVLPIMYTITDNAATTITCSEVANWQLMGITDDSDRFYIGQNTRKIIDDISQQSGVGIEIIDPGSSGTKTVKPDWDLNWAWQSDCEAEAHHDCIIDENDATRIWVADGDENKIDSFGFDTKILYPRTRITQLKIYTRGFLVGSVDYRPTFDYKWDGAWQSLYETVELPTDAYGWTSNTIIGLWGSQTDLDNLLVQYKAAAEIGIPGGAFISEVYVEVTVLEPNWHKYLAREFKGQHCIEPLKAVCKLEGAEWVEDHINEKIKVLKPTDFESSGVSLTTSFKISEFEDKCNAIRELHVWGNSDNEVYANAKDPSIDSLKSEQIVDERIMTNADAKEIADDRLAILKTKRPSIRIPLSGTYPALVLGKTVNITFVRPTIAAANYKIRMIERVKFGKTGITTIVHCGLGEARSGVKEVREIGIEKIESGIKLASDLAHKSMTDKL